MNSKATKKKQETILISLEVLGNMYYLIIKTEF